MGEVQSHISLLYTKRSLSAGFLILLLPSSVGSMGECLVIDDKVAHLSDLPDMIGVVDESAEQVGELTVAYRPLLKHSSEWSRLDMGTQRSQ